MPASSAPAARSGTFLIGGDLPVHRLGFGAMRITGEGIWGPPPDRAAALALLRRVPELGINFIDTADSYGPFVSEELIAEALHPYPAGLVVATKAGLQRPGPHQWMPDGRPAHLRERCEGSLKRLRVDRIDLFQLHRIDRRVPLADQLGVLVDLQREGKIRHIGLSEVSVTDLERARALAPIATVQNLYHLGDRRAGPVLAYCAREGLGFIPWYPLGAGEMTAPDGPLRASAERLGATPNQVALAWLLWKSPVILPIPGTSRLAHLESNAGAALIAADDATMRDVERAVGPTS